MRAQEVLEREGHARSPHRPLLLRRLRRTVGVPAAVSRGSSGGGLWRSTRRHRPRPRWRLRGPPRSGLAFALAGAARPSDASRRRGLARLQGAIRTLRVRAARSTTEVEIDVQGPGRLGDRHPAFRNDADAPIEAVYVFPLPHEAAVYDLEMRDRRPAGEQRGEGAREAKRDYEAARSEGKRAALVEEERPNIFTTSLANVMPGDEIDVHAALRRAARLATTGACGSTFPMVVGPRYIPGDARRSADRARAGRRTPTRCPTPRASRPRCGRPDARAAATTSRCACALDLGAPLAAVTSPSHAIDVGAQESTAATTCGCSRGRTLPNRDFVIELSERRRASPERALPVAPTPTAQSTPFMLVAYPPTIWNRWRSARRSRCCSSSTSRARWTAPRSSRRARRCC